jgi:hypothetical protein
MPVTKLKRFIKTVEALEWRKASMPFYWSCPHEYIVRKKSCRTKDYDFIEKLIAKHGKKAQWRKRRNTFLFLDGLIYWVDEPVINRTDERSLLNGGYPPRNVLAQIRERFWPMKEDRALYKTWEKVG